MVKCVCTKPRVPLGCPPCSQNASPATVWWGAPRAVPWGIINIKREETDRGAPLFPHAGHCWAPMFPQRPQSRDIDGRLYVSTEAPATGHCLAPLFPRRPQSRTDMACRTNYRAAPLFLQTPHRLPASVHTCRAPSGPLVPECVCMHGNGVGQPTENFRCLFLARTLFPGLTCTGREIELGHVCVVLLPPPCSLFARRWLHAYRVVSLASARELIRAV